MPKNILHVLEQGVVLDRSQFVALNSAGIAGTITAITKEGKPLLVVDDASTFFTVASLIDLVKAKDGRYNLVAEYLGANVQVAEAGLQKIADMAQAHGIDDAVVIKKMDELVVKKQVAPGMEAYPFAEVPDGFSIGADWSLGQTKIKRKRSNPHGDGTQFYVAAGGFQAMAEAALKWWSDGILGGASMLVQTSEGPGRAYFKVDHVSIGGNVIRRYEIEQIAKYRAWAFPAAKVAA